MRFMACSVASLGLAQGKGAPGGALVFNPPGTALHHSLMPPPHTLRGVPGCVGGSKRVAPHPTRASKQGAMPPVLVKLEKQGACREMRVDSQRWLGGGGAQVWGTSSPAQAAG